MSVKKKIIVGGAILSVLLLPAAFANDAFAQYLPASGQTGFDDYIELAQTRVAIANENPGAGSGTPILAADGVVGTVLLSTGIFGGIAATFFVKGRQGKYAVMGRG